MAIENNIGTRTYVSPGCQLISIYKENLTHDLDFLFKFFRISFFGIVYYASSVLIWIVIQTNGCLYMCMCERQRELRFCKEHKRSSQKP